MQKISKLNIAYMLVFVPLVLLLFVSCSSTPEKVTLTDETADQWNAAVEKTITEPERAAKLKELGQQLIDVSKSIQQDVEAFNQKAMVINEKYDASHEEFQQMIDDFSKKRNPKFAEYRDTIFAMRSEVSADEWQALTD
jgi:hypothetical protein